MPIIKKMHIDVARLGKLRYVMKVGKLMLPE